MNPFDLLSIDSVAAIAGLLPDGPIVAAFLFFGTAALVALCIPGIILPIAISSGALLGPWAAVPVVVLGALAGSQILFMAARHLLGARIPIRFRDRLRALELRIAKRGIWYVVILRMVGVPHFLVTAASALLPLHAGAFAAATLLGMLPGIAIAAVAGSALS